MYDTCTSFTNVVDKAENVARGSVVVFVPIFKTSMSFSCEKKLWMDAFTNTSSRF